MIGSCFSAVNGVINLLANIARHSECELLAQATLNRYLLVVEQHNATTYIYTAPAYRAPHGSNQLETNFPFLESNFI